MILQLVRVFFGILYATGVFDKYLRHNCKYGITTTKNGSFIQENMCKSKKIKKND